MRIRLAAALFAILPGVAFGQAGAARDTQLQRQQSQDEVVLKIRQSQELNRPVLSPEQRQDLEREQRDAQTRQQEVQEDQARRAQRLEHEAPPLPEPQQSERRAVQEQGFERERIHEPVGPVPAPPAQPK